MPTFTLTARGPFSLAASVRFLEGFTPAAHTGPMDLAFPVEGSWRAVGVRVRPTDDGVTGEVVHPADPAPELVAAVRTQVERILSLDVDGSGYPGVGARDPVIGALQRRFPGLRPTGFWSPYEAAAWAIIGHRVRIPQAAAVKARMAAELGEDAGVGSAFPAPQRLAELDAFPGLSGRKPEWLRGIARAALDGLLDGAHLRFLPRDAALAALRELPGIGPFSAELILLRGAGDPDGLPRHEPRLARAVGDEYGLAGPATPAELERIGEGWRPYRTWVSLLLRASR